MHTDYSFGSLFRCNAGKRPAFVNPSTPSKETGTYRKCIPEYSQRPFEIVANALCKDQSLATLGGRFLSRNTLHELSEKLYHGMYVVNERLDMTVLEQNIPKLIPFLYRQTMISLFRRAVQADPTYAEGYTHLGCLLAVGEVIRLDDGTEVGKKDFIVRALRADLKSSAAYNNLGVLFAEGIRIPIKKQMDVVQKLFLKAIDLDPENSDAYYNIALTLSNGEHVVLFDGIVMTQADLYLKAIHCEVAKAKQMRLGNVLQPGGPMLANSRAMMMNHFVCMIDKDGWSAVGYVCLGHLLTSHADVKLLDGRSMKQMDLFLKALKCDPEDSIGCIYFDLGRSLSEGQKVKLFDATEYDARKLFITGLSKNLKKIETYQHQAASLSDPDACATVGSMRLTRQQLLRLVKDMEVHTASLCHALAQTLSSDEKIELEPGRQYNRIELAQMAVTCDPHVGAYNYDLAKYLGPKSDITVKLRDGTVMTQKQLFVKAIHLMPKDAEVYYCLAMCLDSDECILLSDGRMMWRILLIIEAIRLDPSVGHYYYCLASFMTEDDSIALNSGKRYSQKDLYLSAIRRDPEHAYAYCNLGATLKRGERVPIPGQGEMTQDQLYLKAIKLDPTYHEAYRRLGEALLRGQTIRLLDGCEMTQQKLLLKAIALNPNDYLAYIYLANSLSKGTLVTLPGGKSVSQLDLYVLAISIAPHRALPYASLGSLPKTEKMTHLLDGRLMSDDELFEKSLYLEPKNPDVQLLVGNGMANGSTLNVQQLGKVTKEKLIKSAASHPRHSAETYISLGNTLSEGEVVNLRGVALTKQKLYLEALQKDPFSSAGYCALANMLPDDGWIALADGVRISKKLLYVKAVECDRDNVEAYCQLGLSMIETSHPEFILGITQAATDLFHCAITIDPNCSTAYLGIGMFIGKHRKGSTYQFLTPQPHSLSEEQLYLKAITCDENNALPYLALGTFLGKNKTSTMASGRVVNQREAYLQAVSIDPANPMPYELLAKVLDDAEEIQFGERKWTKVSLLIQAILLKTKNAQTFCNLARTLKKGEKVVIREGIEMTKIDLFCKAIERAPRDASIYCDLANELSGNMTAPLPDGKHLTKAALYVRAIAINPYDWRAYYGLANEIPVGSIVRLQDGRVMSKAELYRSVIYGQRVVPEVYYRAAMALPQEGTLQIMDEQLRKKDLLIKVINFDPRNEYPCYATPLPSIDERKANFSFFDAIASAYLELGLMNETVIVKNGTKLGRKQLFLRALVIDSRNPVLLNAIGETMVEPTLTGPGGVVFLQNSDHDPNLGQNQFHLTKLRLFYLANKYNPSEPVYYCNLGATLRSSEICTLHNGKTMNALQLFSHAIQLDPCNAGTHRLVARFLSSTAVLQFPDGTTINKKELLQKASELEKV